MGNYYENINECNNSCSWKSKRFKDVSIKIPKFLLKLNNLFLIENIFNNYDEKLISH